MTDKLQVFTNSEFGELRVLLIDGKEYFPATACAKILGYTNPHKAIKDHCKGVTKREGVSSTTNQHGITTDQKLATNYITEGDLYRLIIRSKLPGAERFERWVFDEVLPTIRKQGSYVPDISSVIALTVQTTIRELLPYLGGNIPAEGPAKRILRKRNPGIIGRLDVEVREEIDDMILSKRHTYAEISAYFAKHYDIHFSRSAVGRYAQHLFDQVNE